MMHSFGVCPLGVCLLGKAERPTLVNYAKPNAKRAVKLLRIRQEFADNVCNLWESADTLLEGAAIGLTLQHSRTQKAFLLGLGVLQEHRGKKVTE
jgi:hypothetical protein